MERFRRLLRPRPAYQPLDDGSGSQRAHGVSRGGFHAVDYYVFIMLGVAMLWAWNMFLAAAPYFQHRLSSSTQLLTAFPSTLITISTVTSLASMGVLTLLQSNANYPNRVILSLIMNTIGFTLLALSTVLFRSASTGVYFAFVMLMVSVSAFATSLCQNGSLAYVSGFGVPKYTQGIMTGQGISGVLPCIAQIVSVLSVPPPKTKGTDGSAPVPQESGKSAFAYFLTATAVSLITLFSFLYLLRRHPSLDPAQNSNGPPDSSTSSPHLPAADPDDEDTKRPYTRRSVPILTLFSKLRYMAAAMILTFAISMVFPVYTQEITSVSPKATSNRLLEPACFIPLGFLLWNVGDLCGRLITLYPSCAALVYWPRTMFALSLVRVVWIPLYLLCNVRGNGAVVQSDLFYLVIVQWLFGLTNGFLGSICMMGASVWVEEDEREAAGGFMGLCLVAGLSVGSLATFGIK